MPPMPPKDEIRLGDDHTGIWARMDSNHKAVTILVAAVMGIFSGGIAFQTARSKIVLVESQKVVDAKQDATIRVVQDDSLQMHISMDDLHDEVRGMRLDLRYFDPRIRGGNLPPLPEETPRLPFDPSMGLPLPTKTTTSGH